MNDLISIYCKNNKKTYKDIHPGISMTELFKAKGIDGLKYQPTNVSVNNRIENLDFRCWESADVEFLDYSSPSGLRTFVRSLCFVFLKAAKDVLPGVDMNLEHSISKGYYAVAHDGHKIPEESIAAIKQRMQEIIDADIPFIRHRIRTKEAISLFRKCGMPDKAELIETAGMAYTTYYELDGYCNYFYECLLPSTGCINLFDLVPYFHGMLLRVPKQTNINELEPLIRQDKMFAAYEEHLTLLNALHLDNVGDLNQAVRAGASKKVILVSEAMQEKQISSIAEEIARRYKEGVRLVLISGPSSSGKTTTCKRLEVQLATNLLNPIGISLDDYFVNRDQTPKDEYGDYDFESIYALDLPKLNEDLDALLAGKEIDIPTYDFTTGKRVYKGKKLKLEDRAVIVMEGIHALNPILTEQLPDSAKFRIYVSALTTISLDNHNWIPTTDNRLLRRIVRDYRYRGYSAKETIARWHSVRKGEDKWIFPFQENADAMFNSAMLYELAALRPFAEPILLEVMEDEPEYAEAHRLLKFLRYFNYMPEENLPRTSLLREFVGGGSFSY